MNHHQRCLDERLGFAGLCDSVECIDISYRSVHSANFSADPCQDFYHFACSKWQTQNPISEEQLYLAANINQLRDSVDGFLKSSLLLYIRPFLSFPTKKHILSFHFSEEGKEKNDFPFLNQWRDNLTILRYIHLCFANMFSISPYKV